MRCPLLALFCVALLVACGPGKYGYARTYEPLKAERSLAEEAQSPNYEEVVRDPVGYAEQLIGWFGVVRDLQKLPDGRLRLTLTQHRHEPRHLCAERSEGSCRVTIAERSMGDFLVDITPRADELEGPDRLWVGSLLRVYGSVDLEADAAELPVLEVRYRRHWPRGTYVTTAARATMRR